MFLREKKSPYREMLEGISRSTALNQAEDTEDIFHEQSVHIISFLSFMVLVLYSALLSFEVR